MHRFFVAPEGDDAHPGTEHHPVRTVARALALATESNRSSQPVPVSILLRGGVYELEKPLRMDAALQAAAARSLTVASYPGERAVLSGGSRLALQWKPYRDGIFQAAVPQGTRSDQLFVNGERQTLARYPNYDRAARYLGGTAADAFSPERVRRWRNPAGGFVHAMQKSLWGSLHYRIRASKPDGTLELEGGWQIDRDQPMDPRLAYVEGILEELDAPGEWFLDTASSTLYFYPPKGLDLRSAQVEVVRLPHLVELVGTPQTPVCNIELRNLTLRHTARTFMETREPLLRSDWRVYRGGAVLLQGCERVTLAGCDFDQVGGNAIFLDGYNRAVRIADCRIDRAGASGVCCVGRPQAVRNALETYGARLDLAAIDKEPGPQTQDYPDDCEIVDCLITATGRFEKQSAGVEIAMASRITVRHCSIYSVPRAGINVGDGCWGGHRIEGCDVFDTVLETSDHGAYNSWGRDRWWHLRNVNEDELNTGRYAALPTLDTVAPIVLAGNRWASEHGWDIDLDDGSSNYHIENNLCLCGGLKLREGFDRICRNNIMPRNTLHVHVWPRESNDVFESNIVALPYRPVRPHGWGRSFDRNLLNRSGEKNEPATPLQQLSAQDEHSLLGDAKWTAPERGDYSFRRGSTALQLGIHPLPTFFGVRTPRLRKLARQPDFARLLRVEPATLRAGRAAQSAQWMGATVRNLTGLAEVSALGAPGETGVVVVDVESNSRAARAGLSANDLILEVNSEPVLGMEQLLAATKKLTTDAAVQVRFLRHQILHHAVLE